METGSVVLNPEKWIGLSRRRGWLKEKSGGKPAFLTLSCSIRLGCIRLNSLQSGSNNN